MNYLKHLLGKKRFEFKCSQCGEVHSGSPSVAYKLPWFYFGVPENERESRISASDDLCHIKPDKNDPDDEDVYCIRVTMDIPIIGVKEPLLWGVWVTQSKDSFDRYVETFKEDQSEMGSFGWLAVSMPPYHDDTDNKPITYLECDVEWGANGQRPKIKLWENEHQLAVDHRNGIPWDKAAMIAEFFMHSDQ